MIRFTCASCGKTVKAKDELAGKKAKCNACGRMLIVPTEATEPLPPALPSSPLEQPQTAEVTRSDDRAIDEDSALEIVLASQCGQAVDAGLLQKARQLLGLKPGDTVLRVTPELRAASQRPYAERSTRQERETVVRNVMCQFDPLAGQIGSDEKLFAADAAGYMVAFLNAGWFSGPNVWAGNSWLAAARCGAGHKLLTRTSGIGGVNPETRRKNVMKPVVEGIPGEGLLLTEAALTRQPLYLTQLAVRTGVRVAYLFGQELRYRIQATLQEARQFFEQESYAPKKVAEFIAAFGRSESLWVEVALADGGTVAEVSGVAQMENTECV